MSDLFSPAPLAVSQLNALAKNLLETHLVDLWITGEISNLTRAASGHYYFSLKDDKAQIRCALFKGNASRLTSPLKEGDNIELTGKISIYEARGEYQITVTQVRIAGMGRLFEAYEALKEKLTLEGLFASDKKQALPAFPQKIGIVTSLAAAALRDMVTTLKRRMSNIEIIVYPTTVQGSGSAEQIAQAIQTANQRQEVDVLIVGRGGGSIEDLWSFNEEVAVRAIAASIIPTISAVGHETDFTLADFAADLRAPTPTAAAEMVSPNRQELIKQLEHRQNKLFQSLQQHYFDAAQKLDYVSRQLKHPKDRIAQQRLQLNTLIQKQHDSMRYRLQQSHASFKQATIQLHYQKPNCQHQQERLQRLNQQLCQNWQHLWQQKKQSLLSQQALLQATSPTEIMARGYSIIKNQKGKIIKDAAQIKLGQHVQLIFRDSEAGAIISIGSPQQELFD
jgi:exodeoxyribonuclease VII large subunit